MGAGRWGEPSPGPRLLSLSPGPYPRHLSASSPRGPLCPVSLGPRAASDLTLSPLLLGDVNPAEPPSLEGRVRPSRVPQCSVTNPPSPAHFWGLGRSLDAPVEAAFSSPA